MYTICSDEVNRNMIRCEIEGGAYLDHLLEGAVLEVETRNHRYTIVNRDRGQALICGHPQYCPDPVLVGNRGVHLGWVDAEEAVHRTRNAARVLASHISDHPNFS